MRKKKLVEQVMRSGKLLTAAEMSRVANKRNTAYSAYLKRYQRLVNLYHEKFSTEKPRVKRPRDEWKLVIIFFFLKKKSEK